MIGIDIIAIARIEKMFARYGFVFLQRFLNTQEIQILESKNMQPASIAGFWAAKEACSKALKVGIGGNLGFHDILISQTAQKAPLITLTDEKLAYFHIAQMSLSISHD